jgi:iron complex outermembrane receptor protein/vitamin B12 transporter
VALAAGLGAYVNSQSFKSHGVEMSADAQIRSIRVAASYTHIDATVTESLSSSVTPQFNPLFPGIPIGGFSPLVGQRPSGVRRDGQSVRVVRAARRTSH